MSSNAEFDKDEILSSPSLPLIYDKIRTLAKELAVLGKIDSASQITDLLLSQNRTEHGFRQMQFLNFAFEQTGDWPSAIPKSAQSKAALDKLESPAASKMDQKRYDQLINEEEVSQRDPPLCLAIAVALCGEAGKTEVEELQQDDRVIKALEQIAEHYDGYIDALLQQRNIWPLLASGALAQHMDVDAAKLSATAEDAVSTVRTRIENGRQKTPHEGKPIKDLLVLLASNTRKHAAPFYQQMHEDPPDNYLHPPATHSDIKHLESRLKLPLPDDFKSFLLASNGLEPVYTGHALTAPLYTTHDIAISESLPIPDPPPLELIEDASGTAALPRAHNRATWPRPTAYISIGGAHSGPEFLLCVPADVKAGVAAYKAALARDDIDDAIKCEAQAAIEALYGDMQAFEGLECVMMQTVDYVPSPVGTFRGWLEETVRGSGKAYAGGYGKTCLAYECRAKRARRG